MSLQLAVMAILHAVIIRLSTNVAVGLMKSSKLLRSGLITQSRIISQHALTLKPSLRH